MAYLWITTAITLISMKSKDKKEYQDRKNIENWIKQFSFLHEKDCYTNLYHSKGILKGNVWIETTEERMEKIKEKLSEVPSSVHVNLTLRTEERQKWYDQVYDFVQQLEKSGMHHKVDNYVSYNEKNKNHGTIYVVTDPVNFDQIQELSSQLPKGIEIKLCKHAWLIHQLWRRLQEKEELDREYAGEYRIIETA